MNNKTNFAVLLACLFSVSVANAIPVVYFDVTGDGLMDTGSSVVLGDSFTASLYVTDVDTLHGGLISWGNQINFDNSQLSASGYTIAPSWPLPGISNNIDNGSGSIELLASTFTGQSGTIKLADIYFDTLTSGSSMLSISALFPANLSFDAYAAGDGYSYDSEVIFNDLSIDVTTVPVPASLPLLLSGFTLLYGIARKRQR